eukprot:NODE_147_length_15617_cov_0.576750.p8 type:complete len:277 gc:universal NODE_147_length_15617_cov_0.576750:8615-7785(-)
MLCIPLVIAFHFPNQLTQIMTNIHNTFQHTPIHPKCLSMVLQCTLNNPKCVKSICQIHPSLQNKASQLLTDLVSTLKQTHSLVPFIKWLLSNDLVMKRSLNSIEKHRMKPMLVLLFIFSGAFIAFGIGAKYIHQSSAHLHELMNHAQNTLDHTKHTQSQHCLFSETCNKSPFECTEACYDPKTGHCEFDDALIQQACDAFALKYECAPQSMLDGDLSTCKSIADEINVELKRVDTLKGREGGYDLMLYFVSGLGLLMGIVSIGLAGYISYLACTIE